MGGPENLDITKIIDLLVLEDEPAGLMYTPGRVTLIQERAEAAALQDAASALRREDWLSQWLALLVDVASKSDHTLAIEDVMLSLSEQLAAREAAREHIAESMCTFPDPGGLGLTVRRACLATAARAHAALGGAGSDPAP